MNRIKPLLSLALAALLLTQPICADPKPPQAEVFHEKIVKRGVDKYICVKVNTGLILVGRILSVGDKDFTIQLPNDPATTTIPYTDIVELRTGYTRGQKIFIVSAIAGSAAFGIIAAVHFHNVESQHQIPNPPTPPLFP